ncbi:hypothetical protein [Streptomyces canus]|uniref:hypothetical protein n=1 Tax=Streptomyces canus TaxID=58343 RepID=UPI0036E52DE0
MRRRRRAPAGTPVPPTSCGLHPRTAGDLKPRPTPIDPPAPLTTPLGGDTVRRARLTLAVAPAVLSGCGLSGSPTTGHPKPRPTPTNPPHTPRPRQTTT